MNQIAPHHNANQYQGTEMKTANSNKPSQGMSFESIKKAQEENLCLEARIIGIEGVPGKGKTCEAFRNLAADVLQYQLNQHTANNLRLEIIPHVEAAL